MDSLNEWLGWLGVAAVLAAPPVVAMRALSRVGWRGTLLAALSTIAFLALHGLYAIELPLRYQDYPRHPIRNLLSQPAAWAVWFLLLGLANLCFWFAVLGATRRLYLGVRLVVGVAALAISALVLLLLAMVTGCQWNGACL